MTTDTTNKEAGALKPCPMCNASLSEATASGYHHHPANGCIFSGFELSRDDVAAWNRRVPAQVQAEALAWQVRRADGRIDSVPIQWENCTKELYEATLSTGRYAGFENGPRCEVRALVAAPAPSTGDQS